MGIDGDFLWSLHFGVASGKQPHDFLDTDHFKQGKSTISMAMFNRYVSLPDHMQMKIMAADAWRGSWLRMVNRDDSWWWAGSSRKNRVVELSFARKIIANQKGGMWKVVTFVQYRGVRHVFTIDMLFFFLRFLLYVWLYVTCLWNIWVLFYVEDILTIWMHLKPRSW